MMTLLPNPWLDPLLDSLATRLWRGEPDCANIYLAEARTLGPEAVVRVLALEFAILRGRSSLDSRDGEPSLSDYHARLKQALGAETNEDRAEVELFGELIKHAPPPPPDAGFRPGDSVSLGGSPAVLRDYQGSGGEGQVWSASLLGADGKPDLATFAVKFEHERSGGGRADGLRPTNEYRPEGQLSLLGGIVLGWNSQVNGRRVVLSEFAPGGSLRDRLQRREIFPPRDAARIVERVATTLGCLHAMEITHRDIKSANIILDSGDSPWLIDFGLATRTGEADDGRGTRLYMALDECLSQPQADVFGLGTVLFELLAGWAWNSWEDRVAALAGAEPAPGLPDRLIHILTGCLAPRSGDRFADGMALAEALREYLVQDRAQGNERAERRPGPVGVLADFSQPIRVYLVCHEDRCRDTISSELRDVRVSEEPFRDMTEALLLVVRSGVARRIAESPSGSLSLAALASEIPGFTQSWGAEGFWAIEEWGWLLGKAWAREPVATRSPDVFVYWSTMDSLTRFRRDLERTTENDPARRFRKRHQMMKARGLLAWLAEEKLGLRELAITHREGARDLAHEMGLPCVVLEAHVHLAGTLLRPPLSDDADTACAAKLLEPLDLDDGERQHLRRRQYLLARVELLRGNADAACDRLRALLSEISSDDPDRDRWLVEAVSLFSEANAFADARACLLERLDGARARNERGVEWQIRVSEASLAQRSGQAGWEDCFASLLAETRGTPGLHGPIAMAASGAYFDAGRLDRAISSAESARAIQQQQGYFTDVVKTEAWLARCHDRSGDFMQACRYAILAIVTAVFNGRLVGLGAVQFGLRCWAHYPEVHRTANNLLALLMGRGEREDLDSHYAAMMDVIRETELLTAEDREWLAFRMEQ